MDRKEFFKKACTCGFCGCAGMGLFVPSAVKASKGEEPKEDWRIGFIQKRFAKLIDILNSNLDEAQKNDLLGQLGRACSNENVALPVKYKGDVEGYLKEVNTKWVDKYTLDLEKKEIRIWDKPRESCFCPFVDSSLMTDDFCNCSLGWQKQTYENILGHKVNVEINTSILRGGDCCSFIITWS